MNPFPSVPAARLLLAGIALLLPSVAGPLAAQAAAPAQNARFGWVNSQLIIRQVPGYAAAESTLNRSATVCVSDCDGRGIGATG